VGTADRERRATSQELFEEASSYDEMLQRGLRLSGEDKTYFLEGRLDALSRALPAGFAAGRILDFGCGTGDTSRRLHERFPGADVVGIDVSQGALAHARRRHGEAGIAFLDVDEITTTTAAFDLCYSNGAFHHIPPAQRPAVLARLAELLRPGGLLAVFENNAWNPGTRLIMRRVPFDADAHPVSAARMRRLIARSGGFDVLGRATYLFVFPAALTALRGMERRLERVPLGGQYLILGRRLLPS
jgi:SAM-dependent methyltransferase